MLGAEAIAPDLVDSASRPTAAANCRWSPPRCPSFRKPITPRAISMPERLKARSARAATRWTRSMSAVRSRSAAWPIIGRRTFRSRSGRAISKRPLRVFPRSRGGLPGLTAGTFTFREEFTSLTWATRYDFPAMKDGRVKRETAPDGRPSGTQGWFMNTRRPQFATRACGRRWRSRSISNG